MIKDLLHCPFCKGEAKVDYRHSGDMNPYIIYCDSVCGCSTCAHETLDSALKAWNMRAVEADVKFPRWRFGFETYIDELYERPKMIADDEGEYVKFDLVTNTIFELRALLENARDQQVHEENKSLKEEIAKFKDQKPVAKFDPVIDECEFGHKFAKLEGHPKKDGRSRCPNCMAIGLDRIREK